MYSKKYKQNTYYCRYLIINDFQKMYKLFYIYPRILYWFKYVYKSDVLMDLCVHKYACVYSVYDLKYLNASFRFAEFTEFPKLESLNLSSQHMVSQSVLIVG